MAFSVNKVTLVGNISQDPELTYTPKGTALLKFSMATNQSIRNDAGEWEDKPSFHRIVVWAKAAEVLGNIVKKGDKVYVDGRIEYGSYEGQDGIKRYTTDIVAQTLIPMSNKGGGVSAGQPDEDGGSAAPTPSASAQAPASAKKTAKSTPRKTDEEVKVDDIPF